MYRIFYYLDECGRYLHVEIGTDLVESLAAHKAGSHWYGEIKSFNNTKEVYGTRIEAESAVQTIIKEVQPIYSPVRRFKVSLSIYMDPEVDRALTDLANKEAKDNRKPSKSGTVHRILREALLGS